MSSGSLEALRHGQTVEHGFFGSTESQVTAAGRNAMWAAVAGKRWDAIYTSPRRRCAEFAGELARSLDVRCHVDARLSELNFGEWEGLGAAQVMERDAAALQRFWADPEGSAPPGGEPFAAFRGRVMEFLQERLARHEGRVLVVTHAGPIRTWRAHAMGTTPARLLEVDAVHATLYDLSGAGTQEAANPCVPS